MSYVLHYAPDNASLIIRLALEHIRVPYRTRLVDRSNSAQKSASYLALNPNGLIPTLETDQGALFETGAILLWLNDRHGGLGPAPDGAERGAFLKWLFFVSNTLHPCLRQLFYPAQYIGPDPSHQAMLRQHTKTQLTAHFTKLDRLASQGYNWCAGSTPSALDFYIAATLRWPSLYPSNQDRNWHQLSDYPALYTMCQRLETLPLIQCLMHEEGFGPNPFTAPQIPNPPQGSAT